MVSKGRARSPFFPARPTRHLIIRLAVGQARSQWPRECFTQIDRQRLKGKGTRQRIEMRKQNKIDMVQDRNGEMGVGRSRPCVKMRCWRCGTRHMRFKKSYAARLSKLECSVERRKKAEAQPCERVYMCWQRRERQRAARPDFQADDGSPSPVSSVKCQLVQS